MEHQSIDSKIILWAAEVLKIKASQFLASKIIVKTPWSSVMFIQTDNGSFYIKHTPEFIALEAKIIKLLDEQFHAPVPIVIAENTALNCFLMKDAGVSLRSILKKQFDTALFCRAILQFTALQIRLEEHIDAFINIGVPDWRLNRLPDLYKKAIAQKDILLADGLSEIECKELENLYPKISDLCKRLSTCAIKETIVQPDFNDNNTLIDNKSGVITIIDLGEIAIAHPFFSLINCLHVIKKHHSLTEKEDRYLKIKDACLENYLPLDTEQNVLEAFKIAGVLWFVYGLLAYERLIQACDKEHLKLVMPGKLNEMLKELIAVCRIY